MPPEQVTHTEHLVLDVCDHCQIPLAGEAGPDYPPPKRFHTIELPKIALEVIEYQAHTRICGCCGRPTQATISAELRRHSVVSAAPASEAYGLWNAY